MEFLPQDSKWRTELPRSGIGLSYSAGFPALAKVLGVVIMLYGRTRSLPQVSSTSHTTHTRKHLRFLAAHSRFHRSAQSVRLGTLAGISALLSHTVASTGQLSQSRHAHFQAA